jgi:hypothetical protein
VLSGDSIARVSVSYGWPGVFTTLAGVSALAAIAAGRLYFLNAKAAKTGQHLP